jgi:hypothetical protein
LSAFAWEADCKRGRLTSDERDRLQALADRGLTSGQIARRLNRHPATVNFAMHALGLKNGPAEYRGDYVRNGRLVKAFTEDEDGFIQSLRLDGLSTPKIAERVRERFGHTRTAPTIGIRLKMLAGAA